MALVGLQENGDLLAATAHDKRILTAELRRRWLG
jgi:hypothetical protein